MVVEKLLSALTFIRANQSGLLCVLGGFLLNLCFSLDFSYANLNTYITSYMRSNGNNDNLEYKDFIFLSATKSMSQGLLMFVGGLMSHQLGARVSIVIGCITLLLGYSLTFLTLDSTFPMVILSIGCCHGLGFCLVYSTVVGVAQQWFPATIRGLISSLVLSGYGFGSFMWIPMETAFVNPNNVDPAGDGYYVDEGLLSRVPWLFLAIGGCLAGLSLPGVLLLREPPKPADDDESMKLGNCEDNSMSEVVPRSMTPRQVLQSKVFYKIWLGQFANALSQVLLANWQKSYGLTLVSSDRFHANVGIVTSLCNGFSRILWGSLYDRFGYRRCTLAIGLTVTAVTLSLPLLNLCERNSHVVRVLWFLLMATNYSTFPGSYAIMAASMAAAFGPAHYRANFGLLFTLTVAYYIVFLICSQVPFIFDCLGFVGMFIMSGGVGLLGLLVTATTPHTFSLTEPLNSIPKRNK